MQISQYLPGRDVRARGARWRVVDVRPHESCTIVTLCSMGARRTERRLIEPFDVIEPIAGARQPEVVSTRRWRFVCRHVIAADGPPGGLRQADSARIDLLPHQLEPAMALISGLGTRVLLADDVGLGKTIQAGLIVQALCGRGWTDRVLVIAPAGLRDQWRDELQVRFAIDGTIVDARMLRRLASNLPVGTNPWSTLTVGIASTDYIKRSEVLSDVIACRWDVVIVDEAHGVEGDSDRHDAVDAIAGRASYVLLLTATPHNGDQRAFASLCALGSHGEPLLVFRRRRNDVRMDAPRRMHTIAIRPYAAERQMHALLNRYSAAVRSERGHAWLALSVLHKRAFSGAWALHQSVTRRLAMLTSTPDDARQIALPFADAEGELDEADAPPAWPTDLGLHDAARERDLLTSLAEAARMAACNESKVAALRRLLRRAHESAIVFTEYRDTLMHLHRALADLPTVVLHGGLTREERKTALAAFAQGPRIILLATDAAGEGLNLHRTCRLVVNLELPWNPMRLEQRAGRVDRIGQQRTVHAFHLVADTTGEIRILDRLKARIARARTEIGAPDPIGADVCDDERRVARLVVENMWSDDPQESATSPPLVSPDIRSGARAEADRLRFARALTHQRDEARVAIIEGEDPPLILNGLRRRLRLALGSHALLIWQTAWENTSGVVLESRLVPILLQGIPPSRTHAQMKRTVKELTDRCGPALDAASAAWFQSAERTIRALVDGRALRERSILARAGTPSNGFQPGLFDRRGDRSKQAADRTASEFTGQIAERLAHVEHWSNIRRRPPRLVLVALP